MSNLHSLPINELKKLDDQRSSGGNGNKGQNNASNNEHDGDIWKRIDSWLHMSKQLLFRSNITKKDISTLQSLVQTIDTEWKWYKQEMKKSHHEQDTTTPNTDPSTASSICKIQQKAIEFCREIVFTHMDCQSLNILTPVIDNDTDKSNNKDRKKEESAKVHLIDFEYASFNRRAIDIANTFLEHCDMNNLKPNYETEYPTKEEQNLFLISYLRQYCHEYDDFLQRGGTENSITDGTRNEQSLFLLYDWMRLDKGDDKALLTADQDLFLDAIRVEIAKHSLFSHLEWSCWSIIQSMQSTIDFDYVKYARLRIEGYFHFKEMCWK